MGGFVAIPEELQGKTPDELRDIVEYLDAHLRAMHQNEAGELRELTEAEDKAFQAGLELRDRAMNLLEEHRKIADVFKNKPESVERALFNIQNRGDTRGDAIRMSNFEARDTALRRLDDRLSASHLTDDQKHQIERYVRRDHGIARRIIVTENDDYRNAWMKMITEPTPWLTPEEGRAVQAFREYERAMAENVTTAGGFGVPVFIDPSIILTAQGSGNPFLSIARVREIDTNVWKGVTSTGVTWSFDTEAAAVSDDSPVLAQPTITVHMARGFIPYSIEVGQDYPGFAEEMSMLLAEGYDELLVEKFTTGSGTGEPQGVLTGATVLTTVTTDGSFGVEDVLKGFKELPQRFRRNASWMMSVDVNNRIRVFGGANLYSQTVDLTAAWADVVLGKPVYENPYFADFTGTTGAANIALVGDFRNYLIVRRAGMTVELVPHLFDVTANRPTGQRGWFAYARVGGGVVNANAFRKIANT